MRYAPRQRKRWSWQLIAILAVIVMLLLAGGIWLLRPSSQTATDRFRVCSLSEQQTLKALHKNSNEVLLVQDYLYYGESLALYEQPYSPEAEDTLSGNTVELYNVCSGESISMTMENYVDQKIHLDELEPGFYEVYIIEDLVRKRVAFTEALSENRFTTVKRNGKVNRVELIADKQLLKDYGKEVDQHYVFLSVQEETPAEMDVDVLIDPYGMNMDLTWLPDEGYSGGGLKEYEETYEAALLLKEELESYGLRVAISKASAEDEGKAYGENGRLAKGYDANARYYLFLRFNYNEANKDIRGFEIHNSYYCSHTLARSIIYQMEKELSMPISPLYSNPNDIGIVTSYLMKSELDNKTLYDSNLYLRESGGRATLAGRYSKTSQEQNAAFAQANGMQGLEIDFGYLSNSEDIAYWKKHKKAIIQTLAKAFAEGINVSVS